jgi:hypothetical protein
VSAKASGEDRVRESFAYDGPDGVNHVLRTGDEVHADHPALEIAPTHFEPVSDYIDRRDANSTVGAIETASAAPGEKRTRTRPTTPSS